MKRYADDEILGRFVPRGVGGELAAGEPASCARLHCARPERAAGTRAHRWAPRDRRGPAIELCSRCHTELVTILGGG